jgi:Mrp family chromosome partitioning ATPase
MKKMQWFGAGPWPAVAIRQFVTDVYWDELDYLVIDYAARNR